MAAALAGEIHNLTRVVALVTGAASGLGRATAARLAKQVRVHPISHRRHSVALTVFEFEEFEHYDL